VFDIVLCQPEIPPNAGNVIRLAANTGARLHLVEPLGFSMDDKQLKRAGLDYHEYASVRVHPDWASCLKELKSDRVFALTTSATNSVYDTRFRQNDAFVFGSETAGLPRELLAAFKPDRRLRLPMRPGNRSLNLSNAVAVTVFEAWRQLGFL
jgi:tRNA (cytidine/uridine-2'-O-)-methyltransferase